MGVDPLSIALVATSVGSQGASFASSRKGAKAMKSRNAVQARMDQLEVDRKVQDQLARARAIRARTINIAEQTGVADSSATAGQAGAIVNSALDNIDFLKTGASAAAEMNRLGNVAADAQGDAAVFGAVAGVADMFATATGAYTDLFSSPSAPPTAATKSTAPLEVARGTYTSGFGGKY